MATKLLAVTLEVISRLNNSPLKPSGHVVEHYRIRPAVVPAAGRTVVYPAPDPNGVTERVERADHDDGVEEVGTIRVETTIDPGSVPPDVALDPFKIWVVKALFPVDDTTLNGLVDRFERKLRVIMTDDEGRPTGRQIMQFEASAHVSEFDPEVDL